MSITELLQRITNSQLARERNRRTTYHDMVRQVAEGHEPPSEEVDQLLRETGKTAEQFAADVELMTRRLKWRAEYDTLPKHRAEIDELNSKIAACNKVLEAAEKKHDEDTNPLLARMAWL
ncbi:MAG: hypothetical protein RIC55_00825 [Pirellulaceae bacterium]